LNLGKTESMRMICRPAKAGRSRAWSAAVLLKYTLLQLPELAVLIIAIHYVREWIHLPSWAIWIICLLWIAKDVILYPFVWRAYDWGGPHGDGMIGERGVARGDLSPQGYVEVRGELWRATLEDDRSTIQAGRAVRILGRDGLTLTVEPLEDPSAGGEKERT
jgi:membrane protein implicated in regulation of membrane protease activity